jgi:hypothetical protein
VEQWAKLIEAIGGLVGAAAWPIAIVVAVGLIMRRHNAAFSRLIDRITSLQFPGGQIDLSEAVAAQKEQVEELAEEVASQDTDEEQRRQAAHQLAVSAADLGRIQESQRIFDLLRAWRSTQNSEAEAALAHLFTQGMHAGSVHLKWPLREPLTGHHDTIRHSDDDDDDPPAAVGARR